MGLARLWFTPVVKPLKWAAQASWYGAKQVYGGGMMGRAVTGASVFGAYGVASSELSGMDALGEGAAFGLLGAVGGATPGLIKGASRANKAAGLSRATRQVSSVIGAGQFGKYMKSPSWAKEFNKYASTQQPFTGNWTKKALGATGRTVGRAGRFAFEHPGIATAGIAAVTLGPGLAADVRGAQTLESPTLGGADVNVRYDRQTIAAQKLMAGSISPMGGVGTYPQYAEMEQRRAQQDMRMRNSTQGLVQGLHAGRHG